jgi:hypothetical protein
MARAWKYLIINHPPDVQIFRENGFWRENRLNDLFSIVVARANSDRHVTVGIGLFA